MKKTILIFILCILTILIFADENKIKIRNKPGARVCLITPFNGNGLQKKLNIGLGGKVLDKLYPFSTNIYVQRLFFEFSLGYFFSGSPGTARIHFIPLIAAFGYEIYTFGPVTLVGRLGLGAYGIALQPENVFSIDPAAEIGVEFLFARDEDINISMVFNVDYINERIYNISPKFNVKQDAWIMSMGINILYGF